MCCQDLLSYLFRCCSDGDTGDNTGLGGGDSSGGGFAGGDSGGQNYGGQQLDNVGAEEQQASQNAQLAPGLSPASLNPTV